MIPRHAASTFGIALLAMAAFSPGRTIAQTTHDDTNTRPAAGTAPPRLIDIAHAPAPLYDDPIWHGAADPTVVWMPGKADDGKGEYWMYYTQRRATLPQRKGVDWVHGTALGIATSPDGVHWKYIGVAQGSAPADGAQKQLADPVASNVSWWAPAVFWEGGTGMSGGGAPGDKLHMFVTLVHGIFDHWTGDRTIEHFTSNDGLHWQHVSSLPLASRNAIDPTVYKIDGTWHLWYKNEAAGSRTYLAKSPDLTNWQNVGDTDSGRGHEAPFVWKWKNAYWLIHDNGHGLDVWRSETGLTNWIKNTVLLSDSTGKRPLDKGPGHHPWLIMQQPPAQAQAAKDDQQLLIFYFAHDGEKSYIQLAEVTLGADGILQCDRNKYLTEANQ